VLRRRHTSIGNCEQEAHESQAPGPSILPSRRLSGCSLSALANCPEAPLKRKLCMPDAVTGELRAARFDDLDAETELCSNIMDLPLTRLGSRPETSTRVAMRWRDGNASCNSSTRFASSSAAKTMRSVRLEADRVRLEAKPSSTGSAPNITMRPADLLRAGPVRIGRRGMERNRRILARLAVGMSVPKD